MKKTIVILLIVLFQINAINAQTKFTENEKLYITAKVWGFLKYYHPQISKGKHNWDEQLIEKIPKILKTNTKENLNELLINWINSCGKIKSKKTQSNSNIEVFNKNFDLAWINNNKYFNDELIQLLTKIKHNRNKGKKHYIKQKLSIGNVEIINEKLYTNSHIKDYKYRLLSLFRYWNIIEYFFPYRYQTDQNWNSVLKEMIPKFRETKNETDYHLILLELISKIDDSHAFLVKNNKVSLLGKYFVPFKFKVIENKLLIVGFPDKKLALDNDLKIGDVITKIEGKDAMSVLESKLKYIPASNLSGKYKNANHILLNGNSDNIELTIESANNTSTVKQVKRYLFSQFDKKTKPLKGWEIKQGNIGYINLKNVKSDSIIEIMTSLRHTKALILDLRNGVFDLWGGIGQFLKYERRPFVKILKPDISYPGKFHFAETKNCCYKRDDIYEGKVILLVNENTQSHAEFTGMVFQTGNNVITIGSQTAGADGTVSYIPLLGSYKTSMSGVGIFYPNGSETQRKGLKIDIEVKPTINGIKKGIDEVLEKAILIVKK